MKCAFLFPGQGSQYSGMGREMAEKYGAARRAFAVADRALAGQGNGAAVFISNLCFQGSPEALKLTENTQPALLTCSVAIFRVLEEKGVLPDFVAGHSLGEYSALVAAESLTLEDAVVAVRKRGRYMQEAVPVGAGAMAALLGLSLAAVEEICVDAASAAGGEVVSPANINSPEQIVIAGSDAAVRQAVELAKKRGAKRAIMLQVSAPFHCALMKPAQDRLADDLVALKFSDPRFPLVNNLNAAEVRTAEQARAGLIGQVAAPVKWADVIRQLLTRGVDTFVEVGPGRVLCGLLRQIDKKVPAMNVEDEKSLQEALASLKGC